MTYRVRNIVIALALAVLAALLTSFYVTNYKRHVQHGQDQVAVLVAKHDIPSGTTGSDAASMLTSVQVSRRSVVPGAISSKDQIDKLVASQTTYAGEQISTRRFSSVSQTGIVGQLSGTMRAFQVAGDQNQLLAGTLKDGDHVDIVAALKVNNGELSRVVIRDLKVLKAPSGPATGSKLTGSADQSLFVMLAMTDNQAQKFQLVLSNREGTQSGAGWHLELRPIVHDADSPDHIDSVRTVLTDGLNAYQRRAFGR
ncbi:MAG: Flp pilus assembly protein CpaB [Gaiellaceae bacterium]